MAQNASAPLNGKQITLLADRLHRAFVSFGDLARVVLPALNVHLKDIVENAPYRDQVDQLVQWAEAKGKTKELFLAAVEEVPGNAQLREAVVAVWGKADLDPSPAEQSPVRDSVEAKVVETHEVVLVLKQQMQLLLNGAHIPDGPVRLQDSFSIRDDERPAVKALLARFRQLPAEEQQRLPELLNGLGKLQIGTGDFEGAEKDFTEEARVTPDSAARAEAHYNTYWAALEQKKWDEALAAIREAASLDPDRFTPFPLQRFEPRRILGAGGLGTAFLCRDLYLDADVVVKTLHAAELARSTEEVFREAQMLIQLADPVIIGVRHCDYADPATKGRPYVVMDYFPGQSLAAHVREHGPLSPEDVLAVAGQVAHGLLAAHRCGIYHRDLKPDKVLVRNKGRSWEVKIIDFGLAMWRQATETVSPAGSHEKSMLTASVAGTALYASPEQMGRLPGVAVGPYSDVYSFGKTCCYALFAVPEPSSQQWDTVPEWLAEWLGECLSEEKLERPGGFQTVLNRLDQVSGQMCDNLAVPGQWWTRPANDPQANWVFLGKTPRIELLSRQVYLLEVASGVTDAELKILSQLRGLIALQHLILRGCVQVTDAGLAHLRGFTALQILNLQHCVQVTDAGLAHLRGFTALQILNLQYCVQVTDAGLAHLRGLTDLQHLDLAWCKQVTDAGLAHLRGLTDLLYLDLDRCQGVTDAGLAHLQDLTALQHLSLWSCKQVTDAGLAHLRSLTDLQHLSLRECEQVTDAGLAHLQGLTALQHLSLAGCVRVTDAGLAHLQGLTALQHLFIWGCKGVTDAGLKALRDALPRCKIR
jgi:tetratricopeptide (TPR) repeat protein